MKNIKLEINDDLKKKLSILRTFLAEVCILDNDSASKVIGGCGGVCYASCSWHCEVGCSESCMGTEWMWGNKKYCANRPINPNPDPEN